MAKNEYNNWSKEELIKEIERLKKRKKYGVVWEEKPEDVVVLCKTKLPVLVDVEHKGISYSPDGPTNILIEGDNYHALSVLNYTHKGKIDIIYIDPPYNTGARDWKYNNDYVDSNDAYRHSKWLSFMEKRIRLAKSLLKRSSGVLICTIDDNEHAALGLLLQELFPSYEIVGVVIVHNPAGVQGKNFSYTHEIAYFVYPENSKCIGTTSRDKELVSPLRDWGGTSDRKLAKNCFYPIIIEEETIVGFGDVCPEDFHPKAANMEQPTGEIFVYPIDKHGIERKWVYSRNSVEKIIDQLFIKKVDDEYVIMRRKSAFTYRTVWNNKRYYANIYGSKLLNKILPQKFPFPKSLYAVEDCIKAVIHDKNNAIILDFFAGSGTTAHAVLELNREDQGMRQFILCTNNENNICSDVCYPRVKKIMGGYKNTKEQKIEGLGGNLKYFRTDFVGAEPSDKNKKKLTEKATEMLCVRENTFTPVKENNKYRIFKKGNRYTGIIFDQIAIPNFKKEISSIKGEFKVYVFSLGDDTFDEEFEDVKEKVTLSPIPEAILRVYRRIFK